MEGAGGIAAIILGALNQPVIASGIGLVLFLKRLAAGKDEANLICFGDAVLDDIRRLYRRTDELNARFDETVKSQFNAVIANATLHVTRTNAENRLQKLAHIIVNSLKENDLASDDMDDLMRAAVETQRYRCNVAR